MDLPSIQLAPPIARFTIKGLHGYKDVSIEFAGKATIIVAENGVGKTTILNTLNAFISRRFQRLNAIDFTSIECTFFGEIEPLILKKTQLDPTSKNNVTIIEEFCSRWELDEADVRDFIYDINLDDFSSSRSHPVFIQLYNTSPLTMDSVQNEFKELHARIFATLEDSTISTLDKIREKMRDVKILYLPTYRRVEKPLLRPTRKPHRQRSADHFNNDIAYGLADVELRLAELSEEIERRSNFEYRSLSTRMLDELLQGGENENRISKQDLPDIESLSRFLNRVGRRQVGHQVFEEIERLYDNNEIESSRNSFLRYFLSRLKRVIDQTREMELKVERFVDVCNSYLMISSDEKLLSFDPQTLRVVVLDSWTKKSIPLDELSSGEKQIVSLMAHLYLSEGRRVVLMDEPELSLSLPWQRKVLPDIINSGSVIQLLAITHSPFIFENELDHCAIPLSITRAGTQEC